MKRTGPYSSGWPRKPRRERWRIWHVDLLPTLLELLDLPVPREAAGIALGPALRGESVLPGERDLFVDVGTEVSVYRGELFLRAHFGDDLGPIRAGSRQAFRWSADGSWQAVGHAAELARRAERYALKRTTHLRATALGSEEVRRLRALGYIEAHADKLAHD